MLARYTDRERQTCWEPQIKRRSEAEWARVPPEAPGQQRQGWEWGRLGPQGEEAAQATELLPRPWLAWEVWS